MFVTLPRGGYALKDPTANSAIVVVPHAPPSSRFFALQALSTFSRVADVTVSLADEILKGAVQEATAGSGTVLLCAADIAAMGSGKG